MTSRVINLLRQEERRARLRFWRMLMVVGGAGDVESPFTGEVPAGAVTIGVMPKYLRGAFVRAYELRTEARKSEAEVFEEAIGDLMQEHFKKVLEERRRRGEPEIGQFYLGRDWKVYAMPLRQ